MFRNRQRIHDLQPGTSIGKIFYHAIDDAAARKDGRCAFESAPARRPSIVAFRLH